jgi:galactokinase/mevalonate kinase-like predicted kinase
MMPFVFEIYSIGGWQDQVGAITGGFKIARSLPLLPLQVKVQHLPVSEAFISALEARTFLVYTGKQRLAKDMLINALRNSSMTYSRSNKVNEEPISIIEQLVADAEAGATLLLSKASAGSMDMNDLVDELAEVIDR